MPPIMRPPLPIPAIVIHSMVGAIPHLMVIPDMEWGIQLTEWDSRGMVRDIPVPLFRQRECHRSKRC